jgi:hypothetical protein
MGNYLLIKKTRLIQIGLVIFFIISSCHAGSQTKDDTLSYLPQISIGAINGFGPYVLGSSQENIFLAYDLPEQTSKVTFRFLDVDSVQIGSPHIVKGQALTLAYWYVNLNTLNLTLSPQFNVEVNYKHDSIANYYIAFKVYPDTLDFEASAGFGPFITNDYPLSSIHWQQVPELYNKFTVSNLPPRTDTVIFQIITTDSTVVDSLYVGAPQGQYLDSAEFSDVRMDLLPLSTRFLRTYFICSGSPKGGLERHKTLTIIPQSPYIIFKSEGTTLTDSLGVAVQNQLTGHVLSIDSTKYANITNRPGIFKGVLQTNPLVSRFQGPYSFDIINDNFSIEAWIQIDTDKIVNGVEGEMSIMRVDSAWALSIKNNTSSGTVQFIISSLYECDTTIYYGEVHHPLIENTDWHHIAFVIHGNPQPNTCSFYLDGYSRPSYISSNINYFYENTLYQDLLKTNDLYFGGGHPAKKRGPRSDASFVTAIDEIRIWDKELSAEEVIENFSRSILQDNSLTGYWNFNNVNDRKGMIQDISLKNNPGALNNGANLIPQYPRSQEIIDSIRVYSSDAETDSVKFSFFDDYDNILDSVLLYPINHHTTLIYDISALPYTANHLRISEYYPGCEDQGFTTDYNLDILAPPPLVTSLQGWNYYYHSSDTGVEYISDTGYIFNTVLVSGFPQKTREVILGLMKGDQEYDTMTFYDNCAPFNHSLTLNGTDNYIESNNYCYSPNMYFSIMLWFNTTTADGGEMFRYAWPPYDLGPYIRMKADGSLEFGLPISGGTDITLNASNKFNDGSWHCVVATYDGQDASSATLYVDGCIVDENDSVENVAQVYGKIIIGRTCGSFDDPEGPMADYFSGSFSEISTWRAILNYKRINEQMYKPLTAIDPGDDVSCYYKLDEGTGTVIHDYSATQFNAGLLGSAPKWFSSNTISMLAWNCNMLEKEPGAYTFFSKVFYDGGPDTGVFYPQGKFFIKDPVPGFVLCYRLSGGQGYFDEGTLIDNKLELWTNYDRSDTICEQNEVLVRLIDPDNNVLNTLFHNYDTNTTTSLTYSIDMGDVTPGSTLSLLFGYESSNWIWDYEVEIPILSRPIIPPKVTGNFGPFDQAIAPGTMEHENTFTITTEVYDDLNKIITRFYKLSGEQIDTVCPVQLNDTTWEFTYDMAKLSPPMTLMRLEYYLGNIPRPALIQGPFTITIHKTRPDWFDFVPDEAFSDISETQDSVFFKIATTLEENDDVYNKAEIKAPGNLPLVGGCSASLATPVVKVGLTYSKPAYKLALEGTPDVESEVEDFGGGHSRTLKLSFHSSENNYYYLDQNNNLFAVQNMSEGGNFSTQFQALEDIVEEVKKLINIAEATDPYSLIVSPSFSFTMTGGFQYSSRLNLQIDTLTGKWGSVGDLKVNGTDVESEAYKKSASFHFYSGDIGAEFSVGAKLLTGLVEGEFCTVLRFDLGFGHSWISLPVIKKRPLKSFEMDVYGKFVIKVFWGWYSKTVWGPEMFYSTTLWGDHLKDIFPEPEKIKIPGLTIPANSSWPELAREINPIGMFSKMPISYPQETILSTDKGSLFTWVQRGKISGERSLQASLFDKRTGKFSDKMTIAVNNNALNTPDAAIMNDSVMIFTWAQARHTNKTILEVDSSEVLKEFISSQDIYFSVCDSQVDSVIQTAIMDDDFTTLSSGRAEGNPKIIRLTDNRAMIIWQVANFESRKTDIWYSILERQDQYWATTPPHIAVEINGIETNLKIESPIDNQAIMIWIHTNIEDNTDNHLMSALFDGESWSSPEEIYDKENGFFHNDIDMDFTDGKGAVIWTTYVKDSLNKINETVSIRPWDPDRNRWNSQTPTIIYTDSLNHIQTPEIKINEDGTVAIAMKIEELAIKTDIKSISQVDLLIGNIDNVTSPWLHIPANEFVCDTTKQVADLDLAFAGRDTLMLLSHEYVMLPTNSPFEPKNGMIFGDPYMNLVLRSFIINPSGTVSDIDEDQYFTGIEHYAVDLSGTKLYQNYPNPCTDHTNIRFYISEAATIKLELFDINGISLGVLADQEMLPGTYEMFLNTSLLKPGTYICQLTAGDITGSIKIIIGD